MSMAQAREMLKYREVERITNLKNHGVPMSLLFTSVYLQHEKLPSPYKLLKRKKLRQEVLLKES